MSVFCVAVATVVTVAMTAVSAHASIAYHDFNGTASTDGPSDFVTAAGVFSSGTDAADASTPLLDHDTGATLGTLTSLSSGGAFSSSSSGSIGSPGTPMFDHFNGVLDLDGSLFSGSDATLTFSGLDASETYVVTLGINRDSAGPSTGFWHQNVIISGADAFTNTSTLGDVPVGFDNVNDVVLFEPSITGPSDASTLITANNNSQGITTRPSIDGFLVQYSEISTGIDGSFTITLDSDVGNQYINGLSLEVVTVPEPGSVALLVIGTALMVVRRAKS